MKRHLFLVLNHGSQQNPLPNVKVDRDGYLSFFQSPEGGYWKEDEISVYNNDFNFSVFKRNVRFQEQIQQPYDFIVFVFCGHGCMDKNGEQWLEVRPDGTEGSDISVSQIRNVCRDVRTLFIFDACSSYYAGPLHEQRMINFCGVADSQTNYALRCRDLYNHIVLQTPEDTFVAGFAASAGESAGENRNGGYYSQSILSNTRELINLLKTDSQYRQYNHATFPFIHTKAREKVILLSNGRQHPEIDMPRSKVQLPFVVVAK